MSQLEEIKAVLESLKEIQFNREGCEFFIQKLISKIIFFLKILDCVTKFSIRRLPRIFILPELSSKIERRNYTEEMCKNRAPGCVSFPLN